MSTAVMPQNAMYEFGDIIIKVGGCFCVVFVLCSAANLLLLPPTGREPALRRCQSFAEVSSDREVKKKRERDAKRLFGLSRSLGSLCNC